MQDTFEKQINITKPIPQNRIPIPLKVGKMECPPDMDYIHEQTLILSSLNDLRKKIEIIKINQCIAMANTRRKKIKKGLRYLSKLLILEQNGQS